MFATLAELAVISYMQRGDIPENPDSLSEPEAELSSPASPGSVQSEEAPAVVAGFPNPAIRLSTINDEGVSELIELAESPPPLDHHVMVVQEKKRCCNWLTPSKVDEVSRTSFPVIFLTFNVLYWTYYLGYWN